LVFPTLVDIVINFLYFHGRNFVVDGVADVALVAELHIPVDDGVVQNDVDLWQNICLMVI